jgi:hypothetical protein
MEDLRNPIGIFFALLGGLLLTQTSARATLGDAPVNLYTGEAMIVFGLVMLGLAYRGRKN